MACDNVKNIQKDKRERDKLLILKLQSLYAVTKSLFTHTGSAKYLFLRKCFEKKNTEYFLKFLFYLKVQSFRLIMENNFIQMVA